MEHQVNFHDDVGVAVVLVPFPQKAHRGLEVDKKDIVVDHYSPVFHR